MLMLCNTRLETLRGDLLQVGPINASILHEGDMQVEVQIYNRAL